MNSLKTAFVVLLLLGVLYGVYRVLNMPDPEFMADNSDPTTDLTPQIEIGAPFSPVSEGGTDAQPLPMPGDPASEGELTPIPPPLGSLKDSGGPSYIPPVEPEGNGKALGADFKADTVNPPPADNSNGFSPDPSPRQPPSSTDFGEQRAGPPSSSDSLVGFDKAWDQAVALVEAGEMREALTVLSIYYDSPKISLAQQRQLQSWLDPLAGKVIYSMEHHLENPYQVVRGDTLEKIAARYEIPAALLYNINREGIVGDSLTPGTELKVLRGPFHAYVDLEKNRMTLFLRDLYAGHFKIAVGSSPKPMTGKHIVKEKLPPTDARNPVGEWLLDLGSQMSIHGTPESPSPYDCIGISAADAADISSILSRGSSVIIR